MEERLQKILSRAGIISRRNAEEIILKGRVRVNGKKVLRLGTRADIERDRVEVDGKRIASYPPLVYFILNKPRNVVTSLQDPLGRRTVKSILEGTGMRVFPVGRLDYDAEGVLLLTNDGDLAQALLHPRYRIPRQYWVKVKGIPSLEAMVRLKTGIPLDEGVSRAFDAKIVKPLRANCWIEITLHEGRNREIKRLCEAIGHPVLRLFRSRFAFLTHRGLQPGEYRALSTKEVSRLKALVFPKEQKSKK